MRQAIPPTQIISVRDSSGRKQRRHKTSKLLVIHSMSIQSLTSVRLMHHESVDQCLGSHHSVASCNLTSQLTCGKLDEVLNFRIHLQSIFLHRCFHLSMSPAKSRMDYSTHYRLLQMSFCKPCCEYRHQYSQSNSHTHLTHIRVQHKIQHKIC